MQLNLFGIEMRIFSSFFRIPYLLFLRFSKTVKKKIRETSSLGEKNLKRANFKKKFQQHGRVSSIDSWFPWNNILLRPSQTRQQRACAMFWRVPRFFNCRLKLYASDWFLYSVEPTHFWPRKEKGAKFNPGINFMEFRLEQASLPISCVLIEFFTSF